MRSMRLQIRNLVIGSGLLLLFAASSHAQTSGAPLSNLSSNGLIASIIDSFLGKNLISAFSTGGLEIANNLVTGAKLIAGTIALASMGWNLLIAQANRESPTPVIIEGLIYAMIAAVLLGMYSTIVNSVTDFGTWVTGTVGGSFGSSVETLFASILQAIVTAFGKITAGAPTGMGFWTGGLANILDSVVSGVLLLVALFFIIVAIVELVAVVILGPVIVGIAIALGPLFIATLAGNWTRKWFNQWWDFLVTGSMLYAITVVVVTLVANAIGAAINTPSAGGGAILTGQALGIAIVCAALGKVFSQIPALSDGLFPGRHGLRQGSFRQSFGAPGKAAAWAGGKAGSAISKVFGAGEKAGENTAAQKSVLRAGMGAASMVQREIKK